MKKQVLGLVIVFLVAFFTPVVYGSGEINAITVVSSVTDGDTFDTTSEGTIRLADVDAPESWENYSAYTESKNFLTSLIEGKTVYLDVDSLYVTDYYGTGDRFVCMVYIDYNVTHYLNVNQALVVEGFAIAVEFENDFTPDRWALYIRKQDIPEFSSLTAMLITLVVVLTVAIIYRRKLHS